MDLISLIYSWKTDLSCEVFPRREVEKVDNKGTVTVKGEHQHWQAS